MGRELDRADPLSPFFNFLAVTIIAIIISGGRGEGGSYSLPQIVFMFMGGREQIIWYEGELIDGFPLSVVFMTHKRKTMHTTHNTHII